ncbi:hypothetical protein JTE90_022625 [Oedothorax gibbosus]|uniref:Sulfhydryl oxidase n=1 Tax=Oedothorax gibbosus TaxID=931172 RepID=A0AAV6TUT3_9ARAC|nr:hypothetical protein JTE90_022625 [Oedothorax gibbosus]
MKYETFKHMKQAYLGHVDQQRLQQILQDEKDSLLHYEVSELVRRGTTIEPEYYPWNMDMFTTKFRDATPRERLDETVMAFLLRLVAIVQSEMYYRIFQKPESPEAVQAWIQLLKQCIFSILSLLYNVTWDAHLLFRLDQVIMELVYEGNYPALRTFMIQDCKIEMTDSITQAEHFTHTFRKLYIFQIGSFFWRLLHWMAEAMDFRDNHVEAKTMWRELVIHSLYRFLRCGICMRHMHKIMQDVRLQLLDNETSNRQLWFQIHNLVTANIKQKPKTNYSESDLEKDASFMRQALVV